MVDSAGVQAKGRRRGPVRAAWLLAITVLGPALGLAGCSDGVGFDAPVGWWHQLEGGPIADQRPPPPGVNDPFPNLGQIPKRPSPTDPMTRQNIGDALSADRTLAEREAALVPIAAPLPATAKPALPQGTPQPAGGAPPDQSGISASLAAASAPPPPAPRPTAAPTPSADTAPPSADTTPPEPAPPAARVQAGPLPALPDKPPLAPVLPGLAIPTEAPPTPMITGPAPAAPPLPTTGPTVLALGFAAGSAVVPTAAIPTMRQFAGTRGRRTIVITGRGEAASSNADVQAAALTLGLERAQAIATALTATGTPPAAIRLATEAVGRGAYLRLVD